MHIKYDLMTILTIDWGFHNLSKCRLHTKTAYFGQFWAILGNFGQFCRIIYGKTAYLLVREAFFPISRKVNVRISNQFDVTSTVGPVVTTLFLLHWGWGIFVFSSVDLLSRIINNNSRFLHPPTPTSLHHHI